MERVLQALSGFKRIYLNNTSIHDFNSPENQDNESILDKDGESDIDEEIQINTPRNQSIKGKGNKVEECGQSVFLYSNSDAYAGEWFNCKRNGWGVLLKYTGQRFEGMWVNDERHGYGMQTIGSAIKYIGQFSHNDRHGVGIIFHHSGLLYTSEWINGELVKRRLLFDGWKDEIKRILSIQSDESMNSITNINSINCNLGVGNNSVLATSSSVKSFSSSSSSHSIGDTALGGPLVLWGIPLTVSPCMFHGLNCDKDIPPPPFEEDSSEKEISNCYDDLTPINNDPTLKSPIYYCPSHSAEICFDWNVFQVAYFVSCLGLPEYCYIFVKHEVDGLTLPDIHIEDFEDMGIKNKCHAKYLNLSFSLLLKLRLRCIRRLSFSPQRLIDDEYLKAFEIPANELRLHCRIGEGGYGRVYRGTWITRGITVAVKAFRKRDKVTLAREFYSELSVVSRLRHPNVTLFLGVVMSPLYCLVTELVPCGSLFDLLHIKGISMTSTHVLRIAREICCGMAYLHEHGVLHCDLKSSNVLLSNNCDVKIGDFGLATLMESPLETTKMLGCIGTHHWMAPEVLRGEGFTKAADVYSFGMILWEMLTRKIPHEELSVTHIIAAVGYGNRRPLIPSNVPNALRTIILKTWHTNVDQRPNFQHLANIFEHLYQTSILDIEENLLTFFGQ
ncbi:protein kinase domain-containing protein [Cryptosporidium serpentis]